jgi:methionine-rich copper-binding protein CopC
MKHAFLAMAFAVIALPAFAHARLEESTPAANAHVKSPARIVLRFGETLEPAFSGATLRDGAGHVLQAGTSVSGKTVTLLPLPLKPGAYRLDWHSVGQDTHRVSGNFSFTVIP